MNKDDIAKARRLAIKAQREGRDSITDAQRRLISQAVHYMSPENFYMDGELFA